MTREMFNTEISEHQNIRISICVEAENEKKKQKGENDYDAQLLQKLRHFKQENKKLLQENKQLKKINEQLNIQIEELQTNITQNSYETIMQQIIEKYEEANEMAVKILQKVFILGQIKSIMAPEKVFVKWSSNDIISAIALRSLSPKAYRYLRNIKKISLPCESTLHNWVASFHISPGILKDVL